MLRDPRYDNIRFVLLHGGFPYDREDNLAGRAQERLRRQFARGAVLYPSEFKNILKYWLSIYPEKVIYGGDAFPFSEALGAEESFWMAVHSARQALAAALAELVAEKAFTREQALKIAHGYLHDNAQAALRRNGMK